MSLFDEIEHDDLLHDVFIKYYSIFQNIFKNFYPSLNSTGFQERNLSVNFSKAYESIYTNAISWFEFQIETEQHIDLIIIDDNNKKLFIVESKRLGSKRKTASLLNDIKRIINVVTNHQINASSDKYENKRIPNIETYSIYGVILSDIWIKPKQKTKRDFYNTFKTKEKYSFSKPIFDESITDQYHLLSLVWKIE